MAFYVHPLWHTFYNLCRTYGYCHQHIATNPSFHKFSTFYSIFLSLAHALSSSVQGFLSLSLFHSAKRRLALRCILHVQVVLRSFVQHSRVHNDITAALR